MKKILLIGILSFAAFLTLQQKSPETFETKDPTVCVNQQRSITGMISQDSKQLPALDSQAEWNVDFLRKKWNIREYHQIGSTEFKSPLGKTILYSFKQGNIPIVGMEIRIRVDLNGKVIEEEGTYSPIPEMKVDEKRVEEQITDLLQQTNERFQVETANPDSLVIFKRATLSEGELALSVPAKDTFRRGQILQVLMRLEDGKLLMKTQGRPEFDS